MKPKRYDPQGTLLQRIYWVVWNRRRLCYLGSLIKTTRYNGDVKIPYDYQIILSAKHHKNYINQLTKRIK